MAEGSESVDTLDATLPIEKSAARIYPKRIYCFRQPPETPHGLPRYVMIGDPQIHQMQQGDEVSEESLIVVDSIGEEKKFGREHWMPSVGPDIPDINEPFYAANETVSRDHGNFSMGEKGSLL